METIDDEWENFLQNDGDDLTGDIETDTKNIISENNISELQSNDVNSFGVQYSRSKFVLHSKILGYNEV